MESIIKRKQDETDFQYKIRLCVGKLNKEHDLDWSELVELLGLNCSSDHLRKLSYAWKEMLQYQEDESHSAIDDNLLMDLEVKKKELEIAKIQFQDQKREYKHYLRHEGRLDHLLKTMLESIKDEMNLKKPLQWLRPIESKNSQGALLLVLSDLHRGMKTDNHWNKFNEQIFTERLNQVIQEVLTYQKTTGVTELHVFLGGDLIEGNLHRLTKIGETETAVEQTKAVAEALSETMSVFANHFNKVEVYSVKGNHDRVSSRKEEEIKTESFHDFVPWYMKVRLEKFENLIFHENEIDSEIAVMEIKNNTYFGVHGHLDQHASMIQNLTMMIKKFPTAVISCHVHKNLENEIHGVDLIVNGGFAGTNGYAKDGRMTSKAHQKLLWLDETGRRATFYIKF